MSVVSDLIRGGADTAAGLAENAVNQAVAKYDPTMAVKFPGTAYNFPLFYALMGTKVTTLGDLPGCVKTIKTLLSGSGDPGIAALLALEILEGVGYLEETGTGFLEDEKISTLGASLACGEHPCAALIMGDGEALPQLLADYEGRNIPTFLVGSGIQRDLSQTKAIPLGEPVSAMVHMISLALRTAMIYGNIQPGSIQELEDFTKCYFPAVINTLGSIDALALAACAGAMALGIPTVLDMDFGENQIPGMLESEPDPSQTVEKALHLLNGSLAC